MAGTILDAWRRALTRPVPPPKPEPATCRHCAVRKAAAKNRASPQTPWMVTKSFLTGVATRFMCEVAPYLLTRSGPSFERFTDLPPEVRNTIYGYVLLSTEDEHSSFVTDFRTPRGPDTCCLSLLLVSKQTYLETFHIYYRHRNLRFSDSSSLALFLKNIGEVRRFYVTHVTFDWSSTSSPQVYDLLRQCPNLRYLDIYVTRKGLPLGYHVGRYPNSRNGTHINALSNVRGLETVRFFDHGYLYKRNRHEEGAEIDVSLPWTAIRSSITQGQVRWVQLVDKLKLIRQGMMRPRPKKYQAHVSLKLDLFGPRKEPEQGSSSSRSEGARSDTRLGRERYNLRAR